MNDSGPTTLELARAIATFIQICVEAEYLNDAGDDIALGHLLNAMIANRPGFRPDIYAIHALLARAVQNG